MVYTKKQPQAQQNSAQTAIFFIAIAGCITACSPTLNWREVRFDDSPIVALLPCKPDRATRSIELAGAQRNITMAGCEAGGAMFTVAYADVGSAARIDPAIAQWKAVSKATHAVYKFHGTHVVQAAIYGAPQAERDGPGVLASQAVDTFFGGLMMPSKP